MLLSAEPSSIIKFIIINLGGSQELLFLKNVKIDQAIRQKYQRPLKGLKKKIRLAPDSCTALPSSRRQRKNVYEVLMERTHKPRKFFIIQTSA